MTFLEAQRTFHVRRYHWALAEAEREVNESFPTFWLYKGGAAWKFYQFISQLPKPDQIIFLRGLIKRYHRIAAEALGLSISSQEEVLFGKYQNFRTSGGFERELSKRRKAGEIIKLTSKAKLRKAIVTRYKEVFKDQFYEATATGAPEFTTKYAGWLVTTNFWFGRQECLISYTHLIYSEARISHPDNPEITAPAMLLTTPSCWTGMAPVSWTFLMDEDVESACNSAMNLCGQFFNVLPKLLEGLDYHKITNE